MTTERWLPIVGREEERLEVSDQQRVRRASRWRGLGQAVRIEPILDQAEIAALQLDIGVACSKAFGVPAIAPVGPDWDAYRSSERGCENLPEAGLADHWPAIPALRPPSQVNDRILSEVEQIPLITASDPSPAPGVDDTFGVNADPTPPTKPRGRRPAKANL